MPYKKELAESDHNKTYQLGVSASKRIRNIL